MDATAYTTRMSPKPRKGEAWTLTRTDEALIAHPEGGEQSLTILLEEAKSRILIPTFGGKLKHLHLTSDSGEVIELRATGPVKQMAHDFLALAHVRAGGRGAGSLAAMGFGLIVLAVVLGAGAFATLAYGLSLPQTNTPRGLIKLFILLLIASLVTLGGAVRMFLKARRVGRLSRDLDAGVHPM